MKYKTKLQKHCLVLGIIFTVIGIASAWAMVEVVYDSYEYIPASYSEDVIELFGPKSPYEFDWEHYDRFKFDSDKKTINC